MTIACGYDPDSIDIGASIACSGICLTVVERGRTGNRSSFAVDAAAETLRVTTAGTWRRGTRLNLERSLRLGDELGGHMVSGHVDGIAELVAPRRFRRQRRADVARAGGSWPASSRPRARSRSTAFRSRSTRSKATRFSVLIIPHTMKVTTLGALQPGRARQPRSRPDGALCRAALWRPCRRRSPHGALVRAPSLATSATTGAGDGRAAARQA